MSDQPDHQEARRVANANEAAHKAAIQSVAQRNAAAHNEAKKKRVVADRLKAKMRSESETE